MKTLTALLVLLLPTILTFSSIGNAAKAPVISETNHSHDSIKQLVQDYLQSRIDPSKYSKIDIAVGRLDSRLKLTRCEKPLHTSLAPGADLVGKTTVGVRCAAPKPWTLYVPASINLYTRVFQTSGPMEKGQVISAADIQPVNANLAKLNYGYFTHIDDLLGKETRRRLAANHVITPNQVKKPLLIKRGEQVALVIKSDDFSVKMSGTAMMNGTHGDRIRVKNTSSSRVIEGTVTQTGVVTVE